MDGEYEPKEIDDAERSKELIDEIIQRCDENDIEYQDMSLYEDFGAVDIDFHVLLSSGRKKREVVLWDLDDLEDFNNIEFEKYVIIGNYAAICRYDKGIIEAVFTIIDERPRPAHAMQRRVLKIFGIELKRDGSFDSRVLSSNDRTQKTRITISQMSNELRVLMRPPSTYDIGITIKSKFSTHAEAIKILEKNMSLSIF